MRRASGLIVVVAVIFGQAAVLADGYRNPPEGAAAVGRGGSRYVFADDLTVITHNPANLADFTNAAVTVSLTFGYGPAKYTSPSGATEEPDDSVSLLPAVYAAVPLGDGRCMFGLGITTPYGQSTEWDESGLFTGLAPYQAEMITINVSPNFAVRVTDDLTAGAGLNLMHGNLEFRQMLPWLPLPAGLGGPSSRLVFEGTGSGVGGTFGLTWQFTERQRLAASYRTPMTVQFDGDFTMVNPPPPATLPPTFTPTSDFSTEINFPAIAAFGYGVEVSDSLRLEGNVEWLEHSRNDVMTIDIANNTPLLLAALGTVDLPQDWDDIWTFSFGADWSPNEAWVLRGGWTWIPTPVPDATFMPVLLDDDRHILGVGAGYRCGGHAVDLGYVYSIVEDREIVAGTSLVAGTYEMDPQLAAVTYTYTF